MQNVFVTCGEVVPSCLKSCATLLPLTGSASSMGVWMTWRSPAPNVMVLCCLKKRETERKRGQEREREKGGGGDGNWKMKPEKLGLCSGEIRLRRRALINQWWRRSGEQRESAAASQQWDNPTSLAGTSQKWNASHSSWLGLGIDSMPTAETTSGKNDAGQDSRARCQL